MDERMTQLVKLGCISNKDDHNNLVNGIEENRIYYARRICDDLYKIKLWTDGDHLIVSTDNDDNNYNGKWVLL